MRLAFLLAILLGMPGLGPAIAQRSSSGWIPIFDGTHLNHFNPLGEANWALANGVVEATSGLGYLVTKESYDNFELRVEFWVDAAGNSGVYMRCQDATKITDTTCYEANIADRHQDASRRTGAIVHIAPPVAVVEAGGKWNTYEITAKGPNLTVRLNGTVTAQAEDPKFTKGPIALQHAVGTIRFRRIEIRPL